MLGLKLNHVSEGGLGVLRRVLFSWEISSANVQFNNQIILKTERRHVANFVATDGTQATRVTATLASRLQSFFYSSLMFLLFSIQKARLLHLANHGALRTLNCLLDVVELCVFEDDLEVRSCEPCCPETFSSGITKIENTDFDINFNKCPGKSWDHNPDAKELIVTAENIGGPIVKPKRKPKPTDCHLIVKKREVQLKPDGNPHESGVSDNDLSLKPHDCDIALDIVRLNSQPNDCITLDISVQTESQPNDFDTASDVVLTDSKPHESDIASDIVSTNSQRNNCDTDLDKARTNSQPNDCDISLDTAWTNSQPNDCNITLDIVRTHSQRNDCDIASDIILTNIHVQELDQKMNLQSPTNVHVSKRNRNCDTNVKLKPIELGVVLGKGPPVCLHKTPMVLLPDVIPCGSGYWDTPKRKRLNSGTIWGSVPGSPLNQFLGPVTSNTFVDIPRSVSPGEGIFSVAYSPIRQTPVARKSLSF